MNSESLLKKKEQIDVLICKKSKPLIVCCTETCITPEIDDVELFISGYNLIRCNSNSRHTGGVVIYVRNDIKYDNVNHCANIGNYWFSSVIVTLLGIKIHLIVVYRSPGGSEAKFLDYFEEYCNEIILSGLFILIVGDFNIDLMKETTYSKKIRKIVQDFGMKQLVNEPTRTTNSSSTLIDLIITNNFEISAKVFCTPKISDHDIIGVCINKLCKHNVKYENSIIKRRSWNVENTNKISEVIIQSRWAYDSRDVNNVFKVFFDNIMYAIDLISPEKNCKVGNNNNPWFNSVVFSAQKKRNLAYKKFREMKSMIHWEEYKKCRNEMVKAIRNEKTKYFEEKIDKNTHNPKEMWRVIKNLIGSSNVSETVWDSIKFDLKFSNNVLSTADAFNYYFIDSLNDIINSIPQSTVDWTYLNLPQIEHRFHKFRSLTLSELKKIVGGLKNKSGVNCVNVKFIKNTFDVIGYPLLHVINTSLETGNFPDDLKLSTIVPIPKIKQTVNAKDFRPINMLPTCEKILEIAVHRQIVEYFENNSLLMERQSGFRSNHSCEYALQLVITEWRKELDRNNITIAVFIDFCRAFETIDRSILLKKLYYYGIRGVALKWFENYLKCRFQITKINSVTSQPLESIHGVPQGSVLGPLLFLIYINDISSNINKSKLSLFADDTLISFTGNNLTNVINTVNQDLAILSNWLILNRLKLNTNKTKCMIIASKTNYKNICIANVNVLISNEKIEIVNEIKYLGVILDKFLKLNKQVDCVAKKIAKKIGFLTRIGNTVSLKARLKIYQTIVQPHFDYCSSVLFLVGETQIQRLQILQNRGMRVILQCNKYTAISRMHSALNFLPVRDRIVHNLLIFMYKITKYDRPTYFKDAIIRNNQIHEHNTRSANQFRTVQINKHATSSTIFDEGLVLFNSLPDATRNASSIGVFKRQLKAQICDKEPN